MQTDQCLMQAKFTIMYHIYLNTWNMGNGATKHANSKTQTSLHKQTVSYIQGDRDQSY